MPWVPVDGVGNVGVVEDLPPHQLPPEAWSEVRNMRFSTGRAKRFTGHTAVFDPPSVAPYFAMQVDGGIELEWLYAGLEKIYTFSSSVHTEITRSSGDYTGGVDDKWNGGVLGGLPVLTNGVDLPQSWNPAQASQPLVDLPNWPASTTCRSIKPYRNFLVALDITKSSGTRFKHMVKWSHAADVGSVPSSWDETDATKDAGEAELADTAAGGLVDQHILGDVNVLYKEASTWFMQFIGGSQIFRFVNIFTSSGILAKNCVMEVGGQGGQSRNLFVVTGDDVIVHDLQSARSVLSGRLKNWLRNNTNQDRIERSFVARNWPEREMWFCFPETGEEWPNLALVWNWEENTVSVREIDPAAYIASGNVTSDAGETWDSDSDTWDSAVDPWDTLIFNPRSQRMLQADPVNTKLYHIDDTEQFNGTDITSYLRRTGLGLIGQDNRGNLQVDFKQRKLITGIRPKITGGPIDVRIGSADEPGGTVTWSAKQSFDPSTQHELGFTVQGRSISVEFSATGSDPWECHGYELNVQPLGLY